MRDTRPRSPIQQAKARMDQAKREQERILAGMRPQPGSTALTEEEAKLMAAALMELMKSDPPTR